MYRDMIEAPERCTAGGRDWWVRVLHKWDGTLETVILFDACGEYVAEFNSLGECEEWLANLSK